MNEKRALIKSFSCRKDPLIQVISGLKDPNAVLTVNLARVEHLTREKVKQDMDQGRGTNETESRHAGIVLESHK